MIFAPAQKLSCTIWTELKKSCAALCINWVNGLVKNQPVEKWFTILSQTNVRSDAGGSDPLRPFPWIRQCGHKPLDTATGASLKEGYDGCSCLLWNWWKKKARIYTFKIPVSFSTFSLSLIDDIAVKTELQFSAVWKRTWPCKQDIKQNGYYFVSITNIQ